MTNLLNLVEFVINLVKISLNIVEFLKNIVAIPTCGSLLFCNNVLWDGDFMMVFQSIGSKNNKMKGLHLAMKMHHF